MTQTGREYGTALFMLALEKDKKHEYRDALETVCSIFKAEPEYIEFLASPSIPMSERLGAVEAAFGAYVPEDVVSYIQLLYMLCLRGLSTNQKQYLRAEHQEL